MLDINIEYLWRENIEEYRELFLNDEFLREEIYGNMEEDRPRKKKIKNIRKGTKRKYEANIKRGL